MFSRAVADESSIPALNNSRTWQNLEGKQIQATFLARSSNSVALLLGDKKVAATQFTKLCEADQTALRDLYKIESEPGVIKIAPDGTETVGRIYRFLAKNWQVEGKEQIAEVLEFTNSVGMKGPGTAFFPHYGFAAFYGTSENHQALLARLSEILEPVEWRRNALQAPDETSRTIFRTLSKEVSYNFANLSLSSAVETLKKLDQLKVRCAANIDPSKLVFSEKLPVSRERLDNALTRLTHAIGLDWSVQADINEIVICDRNEALKLVLESVYKIPAGCSAAAVRSCIGFASACRGMGPQSIAPLPAAPDDKTVTVRAHPMVQLQVCRVMTALDQITRLIDVYH